MEPSDTPTRQNHFPSHTHPSLLPVPLKPLPVQDPAPDPPFSSGQGSPNAPDLTAIAGASRPPLKLLLVPHRTCGESHPIVVGYPHISSRVPVSPSLRYLSLIHI